MKVFRNSRLGSSQHRFDGYDEGLEAGAKRILDNWKEYVDKFIKVVPIEYKKVLQEEKMEAINKKIAQVERDY